MPDSEPLMWPPFARVCKEGVQLDITVVPNAKQTEAVALNSLLR